ncbi:hypothetical protein RP20_CCG007446 [Aedes albopictus]|nr:hypothetical protein RP20_CCG007446 [Aedes albopictus]
MALVDFSLAFNCVKHDLLGRKLQNEFGFSTSACSLITSYLSQRSQAVHHNGHFSSHRPLTDGTPQGSCLSALLFTIYINSLPSVLRCQYHLYADDLQVYVSGPKNDLDRLITALNDDLHAIECWAITNKLFPNPAKTKAIIFCKDGVVNPQIDVRFCGETIDLSDEVTNLGLIMDSRLKWSGQVNSVTMKVYNTLRTFRRFQKVLSMQTRHKLAQAVLIPFFLYCDAVYYPGLSAAQKEQLHRCFKSVIRFVYGLRRFDSTRAVRHTLMGCDLTENYLRRVCCFMHTVYNGKAPEYIAQHVRRGNNQRARSFIIPRHTTSTRRSLLIYGASTWNSQPLTIRNQTTMSTFKAALNRA